MKQLKDVDLHLEDLVINEVHQIAEVMANALANVKDDHAREAFIEKISHSIGMDILYYTNVKLGKEE